jgi:flavodoxin
MKSVIVYYSFGGNTRKAAVLLAEYLQKESKVDIVELRAPDESKGFFQQVVKALVRTKAKIEAVNMDISGYDLICIGTPVWAFSPAPAINTYLCECQGLQGKDVIVFTTYGSGAGNNRCINHMKDVLEKKGIKGCKSFTVQGAKANDRIYVMREINKHN